MYGELEWQKPWKIRYQKKWFGMGDTAHLLQWSPLSRTRPPLHKRLEYQKQTNNKQTKTNKKLPVEDSLFQSF